MERVHVVQESVHLGLSGSLFPSSKGPYLGITASSQGLRHADENGGGGDGDQTAAKPGFSAEGSPYQKPKTQRIWHTIFLKMG